MGRQLAAATSESHQSAEHLHAVSGKIEALDSRISTAREEERAASEKLEETNRQLSDVKKEATEIEKSVRADDSRLLQLRQPYVALQVRLQQAKDDAETQQQQLGGGGGPIGPSQWLLHDAAVATLAAQSSSGELGGKVYGRLCNVVRAVDGRYVCAVNAALQEVCNPATCLVVSNRKAAQQVMRLNNFGGLRVYDSFTRTFFG